MNCHISVFETVHAWQDVLHGIANAVLTWSVMSLNSWGKEACCRKMSSHLVLADSHGSQGIIHDFIVQSSSTSQCGGMWWAFKRHNMHWVFGPDHTTIKSLADFSFAWKHVPISMVLSWEYIGEPHIPDQQFLIFTQAPDERQNKHVLRWIQFLPTMISVIAIQKKQQGSFPMWDSGVSVVLLLQRHLPFQQRVPDSFTCYTCWKTGITFLFSTACT